MSYLPFWIVPDQMSTEKKDADKKPAADNSAAAAGSKSTSSRKKRDHDVTPDEESPFPWGKVERKKGAVDQVHAFKVFGTK